MTVLIDDDIQSVRFMSTSKSEIYDFTTPEGNVYLDLNRMNANIPVHGFGHLFWSGSHTS